MIGYQVAMNNKKTKKNNQYVDTNPIEALRDITSGVASAFTNDLGKGAASDLWKQLLRGETSSHSSGELAPGQELDLASMSNYTQPNQTENMEEDDYKTPDIAPGIDYRREILEGDKKVARAEMQEMESQVQQIIVELKRLAQSSSTLEAEFKEVTVEQRITHPGKYHVTFFAWVLTVVRNARMRVEDSGAWLAQFKSKKKQKQYWNMFKKHGTTFGLSNERVVATQTG